MGAPAISRLTYNNETHTIPEWTRLRQLGASILRTRLHAGWTPGEALGYEPPPRRQGQHGTYAQPQPKRKPQDSKTGIMRYCATHALAWVLGGCDAVTRQPYAGHWHPLPVATVQAALTLAKAGRCEAQITLVAVPCDRCNQERQP